MLSAKASRWDNLTCFKGQKGGQCGWRVGSKRPNGLGGEGGDRLGASYAWTKYQGFTLSAMGSSLRALSRGLVQCF